VSGRFEGGGGGALISTSRSFFPLHFSSSSIAGKAQEINERLAKAAVCGADEEKLAAIAAKAADDAVARGAYSV
jgi:hypothetical protein